MTKESPKLPPSIATCGRTTLQLDYTFTDLPYSQIDSLAMPPKGASTALKPIRLQTVDKLRIRHPDKQAPTPCLGAMSAMLSE